MNLYEIDSAILDCIDVDTGEVFDETRLNDLTMARDTKIENIALWIKNLKADVEAYKAEAQAFAEKKRRAETKAEQLKSYLERYLDGEKYTSTRVNVSYRKSISVKVDDISKLPEEFLNIPEPTARLMDIKAAIKAGQTLEGVSLVESLNMQIK